MGKRLVFMPDQVGKRSGKVGWLNQYFMMVGLERLRNNPSISKFIGFGYVEGD